MTIDEIMTKLTYSQALVLSISELSAMSEDRRISDALYTRLAESDCVARFEFSRLEPKLQLLAVQWCTGKLGPGAEWDNRRKV